MALELFTLVLLAVVTTEAQGFKCPTVRVQTLVADPEDCRRYHHCLPDGRVFSMHCPGGLVFDPRRNVCIWDSIARSCAPDHALEPINPRQSDHSAANVQGDKLNRGRNSDQPHKTTTAPNRNRKQGHQRRPVPSRQSREDWGHGAKFSTTPAQVTLKPRNPHSPSTTISTQTTTTSMPPKGSRRVKGVMSRRTSFAGAERSAPRKEETVIRKVKTNGGSTPWPRRADQSGRRTSQIYGSRLRRRRIHKRSPEDNLIGGGIFCPSAYAYIPDPLSCFGFYQCYNWQPIKKQCPPGLHFDVKSKICNWQHHVHCQDGDRGPTFNFNRMITVYRKAPRDNTPSKTKTSSSRVGGERPLGTGNNTERPAVTVSTTLASKTSMPTIGMNSTGATNIASSSTSTVRPSPQQLKENIVLFRYSDPLSESKPADDAAQRLAVPESSSYIKDPKSFGLETDQNKSAAKQVSSEKTADEELSRFANVSEKPIINPSSLSNSSDGKTANKTVTASRPQSNRATSDSVRKNSHENNSDDTTVNTVTETSIEIPENTSWASIQGDNSSPAPTKQSSKFQSTMGEVVPEGSAPTALKGNETSLTNATASAVQVDEIATTFNASSPSPFFTQQSTSEIPSTVTNKTASSLTSNSTHVPIEAFKNILPAVSPIPRTMTETAAQTASSDKNQTTPLVSSMTSAPSYGTGNSHTRATTSTSEVPVENRPPQLLKSPGENTAGQVNDTYSFSRPSPPANPPITQSTVVFHKLGVSERSDSPAGVQIEKYMNNPLHQPVTSKRVDSLAGSQDQRNAVSSDDDRRGHVSNAITNKTWSRGGRKQENEQKPSSLFQNINVGKDSAIPKSTPGMKMNRKVVPEIISPVSIPSGVTNKRLSKVQETAITDPASPSVILTQPEDNGPDNVPFVKMDADDQILPQRSGVAQKSPAVRDNAADSEIDYSGDAEDDLDPVTVLARSTRPALEPLRNDPATAYSHFGPDPASAKKQSEWQKENLQPYFTHVPITIEDTQDRKAETVNTAEAATISTITFQNATALGLMNDEVVRHSQNTSANRNASKMTKTVPQKVDTVLMNRDTANCSTAGCTSIQSRESAATVTLNLDQFSTETPPRSPTTATKDALPVSKSANIKPSLPEKQPLTLFMSPIIRAIQQRKDQTERKDNNGNKLQMNVDRSNPQSDSDILENSTPKTEMNRNHQEQHTTIIQRTKGEDITKTSPSLFTAVTDNNSTVGNSTRFQSFSENDTVIPLSDNPVANKSNNESSHQPDSPPSEKCTVNSLASSQPVDDHVKIRVEGDLTDENQHSRAQDTANLTSVHDENSTDQPSIYERRTPTTKKNVSITSATESVPQSTKQTQNPTSPFSFNTTSSSSAEAIGNPPPLDPELREEKETLTAASSKEKEEQVRQKTVSTLVVSVELEHKQNLTLLDVNNTSTFSTVLNTTMEGKQEITDALNPVTTTVSTTEKEKSANTTILNGTTDSSTLMSGKEKSVVTVESKQMPEAGYLSQNSELIAENVTNNNAADTVMYDNSENVKKSENSTVSVTENDRSNTAQQTSNIIPVNTTSPSSHLNQTGHHVVANSSNEAITTAASENASSDKSGISSRTVAEAGSVASEDTTATTASMITSTALNPEMQDDEDQSPRQQLEVVNADSNSVKTNAGQRDNGATSGQDSPVEAPVYRWTEQTAASKTTHSQDASLSGQTDSADKRSIKSQTDTSTKPTATKGGNRSYDSKRSFVSLKDVVVWFLNHWREYMAGTGGSHHR